MSASGSVERYGCEEGSILGGAGEGKGQDRARARAITGLTFNTAEGVCIIAERGDTLALIGRTV